MEYRGRVAKLRELYLFVRGKSDPTTYRVIQLFVAPKLETPRKTKEHLGGGLMTTEPGRPKLPLVSVKVENRGQNLLGDQGGRKQCKRQQNTMCKPLQSSFAAPVEEEGDSAPAFWPERL